MKKFGCRIANHGIIQMNFSMNRGSMKIFLRGESPFSATIVTLAILSVWFLVMMFAVTSEDGSNYVIAGATFSSAFVGWMLYRLQQSISNKQTRKDRQSDLIKFVKSIFKHRYFLIKEGRFVGSFQQEMYDVFIYFDDENWSAWPGREHPHRVMMFIREKTNYQNALVRLLNNWCSFQR